MRRLVLRRAEGCTLCGRCVAACPFGALRVKEGRLAHLAARCRGECRACELACPHGLLELTEMTCTGCAGCKGPGTGCAGCPAAKGEKDEGI